MAINLSEYKKAKRSETIASELEAVLSQIRSGIRELRRYRYYSPVKDLLTQMNDTKVILEVHLNKHKSIANKKGNENG